MPDLPSFKKLEIIMFSLQFRNMLYCTVGKYFPSTIL